MLVPLEKPDFRVRFENVEGVDYKELDRALANYIKFSAQIAKYVVGAQGLLELMDRAYKQKNYSRAVEYMNRLTNRYGETNQALNRVSYEERDLNLAVIGEANRCHVKWNVR